MNIITSIEPKAVRVPVQVMPGLDSEAYPPPKTAEFGRWFWLSQNLELLEKQFTLITSHGNDKG